MLDLINEPGKWGDAVIYCAMIAAVCIVVLAIIGSDE